MIIQLYNLQYSCILKVSNIFFEIKNNAKFNYIGFEQL